MTAPDPRPDAPAFPIQDLAGWRRAVVWPLAVLVRLWGRSLRFEIAPEDFRNITKNDEPVALILWHNRLFMAAEIFRRYRRGRPAYSLVSASKDGAWLEAFFNQVGMRTVRGSSHKLGREAVGGLIAMLRAGHDIGITPDGPRGPCYEFKPGALVVTRRASVPVLLLGGEFSSARRLKSWDRFFVPRPFSRMRIRCTVVPAAELRTPAMTAEELQRRLQAINPD